ncbi:hypothetical protein BH10PLA1_BH10PLA1_17220 [soil metagenome]
MPLSINVGLSRKASRDYQSTGVSINVTAELDQSLLARPDELQQQVSDLYAQAEAALDRQSGSKSEPDRPRNRNGAPSARDNGANGTQARSTTSRRPANGDALMTDSQRRAILSIAERHNADVHVESREIIGAEFDRLTLRQASELIDHLKSLQAPASGQNGH